MSPTPRNSDKTALWLVSVLVVGVGANWIGSWTQSSPWLYLMFVLVSLLIVLTMPGGYFDRDRHGPTMLGRVVAIFVLLIYLVLSPYLASSDQLALTIASVSLLWLAATLLAWRSLRSQVSAPGAASSVAFLLLGVAFLLRGVAGLRGGDTLFGVALLLVGVAFLLRGVAGLRGGDTLFGVAVLLGGVAFVLLGVAVLPEGDTLVGVALLLVGVAALLFGAAGLPAGDTLRGVAVLLGGVGFVLVGVALIVRGITLGGVGFLLLGVALMLPAGDTLRGVAFLLVGVWFLGAGGGILFGVAFLLVGAAVMLGGRDPRPLPISEWRERLTRRDTK